MRIGLEPMIYIFTNLGTLRIEFGDNEEGCRVRP